MLQKIYIKIKKKKEAAGREEEGKRKGGKEGEEGATSHGN